MARVTTRAPINVKINRHYVMQYDSLNKYVLRLFLKVLLTLPES